MRIIGGTHRSRKLLMPKTKGTRPILDQQKESLFNIIQPWFPCAGILDIFAGSGSIGLEALSRGAEQGTLVERGQQALEALRANVKALGLSERAKVLARDAFAMEPERLGHQVDVCFLDPPFPLYEEKPDRIHRLIGEVMRSERFDPEGLTMLRVPKGAQVPGWPEGVSQVRERPFGESHLYFLQRTEQAEA